MFLLLDQGWSKIPTCATREVCCQGRPGVDWLHFLLPGQTNYRAPLHHLLQFFVLEPYSCDIKQQATQCS